MPCEKPLALNMADAREMLEICKKAHVVLDTNHHLGNALTHRALRRLIKEGAIGKPLAVATAVLESAKSGQRVAVQY